MLQRIIAFGTSQSTAFQYLKGKVERHEQTNRGQSLT